MKKIYTLALGAFALLAPLSLSANDMPIPVDQLPAAAQTFVTKTFPGKTIVYAEKDLDYVVEYEARLSDGTKVKFTEAGDWKKVDCNYQAVPAALVPEVIATYVTTNYPGTMIVEIKKAVYGYEVKITNGLELKFNPTGTLLGIDD
ncbi:MAG: PepSY-like domain-containing protein [Bacteroidales bacterium]|nr:PepSY-like domain-containing protein [Bacteroidales bacterium]